MSREVRMINSAKSLESMRDLGIDEETGVGECSDNSIDAGATKIRIHIGKSPEGNLSMIFADNGKGIPEEIPNRPDVEHTVQHVLRFGGKISHMGRNNPIGRFGYGLSQSVLCLSDRAVVYSKCAGSSIRTCYYDLEELRNSDAKLPDEEVLESIPAEHCPPDWNLEDSGTVVCFLNLDRGGYKLASNLARKLDRELGRIYRRYIASGLEITITTSGGDSFEVQARDPICQLPFSMEVKKFGIMPVHATCSFRFDGKDLPKLPEIIDPKTGTHAIIRIRMVKFDVEKVWKALGVKKTTGTPKNRRELTNWGFSGKGRGFSVMRNGRELDHKTTLGCYTDSSMYNYFRGEIEFPAVLDDYFNVQNIKGRFNLNPSLKASIRNRCANVVKNIANEATSQLRALEFIDKSTLDEEDLETEKLTEKIRNVVKRKQISREEHDAKKKHLQQRKESVISQVKTETSKKVADAEHLLSMAKSGGDKAEIDSAEDSLKDAKEEQSAAISAIRKRFEIPAFCRKWVKPLRDGVLYAVEDYQDEIWVTINSESAFFQSLYERASQHTDQAALLDLIIFAIAYTEVDSNNSAEMVNFWRNVKQNLSMLTYLFSNMVRFEDKPPEDVGSDLSEYE
ncbi:MAG: ATP-binding protein [Candidatus Poseidoniaceae archaeon]